MLLLIVCSSHLNFSPASSPSARAYIQADKKDPNDFNSPQNKCLYQTNCYAILELF